MLYDSTLGQELYYDREINAEENFTTLFKSKNFKEIKTRRTKKMNFELTIHTITNNIKKIHKM